MKDYIKELIYFKNLDAQDYHAILRCFSARLIHYEKGANIINIGDNTNNIYIIASGLARSKTYDLNGKTTILKDYYPNDIFGIEFEEKDIYTEELIALTDTYVVACNRFRFITPCANRCKRHTDCMKNTFINLASQMQAQSNRIHQMSLGKSRQKIYAYLSELSKGNNKYFRIPYNQSELATYLGLERSALSYELNNMKRDGLIDFDGDMFKIKKKKD